MMRRIDRIMIPSPFRHQIWECFLSFLANSDHKALVLCLRTHHDSGTRRKRCPNSFIQCTDTIENIADKLKHVSTVGFAGWEDFLSLIRTEALAYEKNHKTAGIIIEAQALLRESDVHHMALGTEGFLAERGYTTSDPATADRRISAIAEQEDTDRTCQLVADKMKTRKGLTRHSCWSVHIQWGGRALAC